MAKVYYSKQADKTLRKMPRKIAQRVVGGLKAIAAGNKEGQDIVILTGRPGYRLRKGDWRAIYNVREDGGVDVLKILPRGKAYK